MDKLKALLTSRRRVFLITLGLLLLFDLGRSIYARVGSAEPSEVWKPDPQAYTDMTWPPGADLPADTPTGQRIYMQHCALCHGPAGRGNGPASPALMPRPRDFTLGQFKYKSTLPGQPPSDADLINVVTNGLYASAMPYWKGILNDADIRQVVSYIKTFSPVFNNASPQAITIPPRVTPDAASIGRGKNLFTAQGCTSCHGNEARGSLTLKDAKGFPVISRDLTAPWTFRGGSEPEQIYLRLTTGTGARTDAVIRRQDDARRPVGFGELCAVSRAHAAVGSGRKIRRAARIRRPHETRRLYRPFGDVRHLSHAGGRGRHL